MKIAFFDTHAFERPFFEEANAAKGNPHEISFFEPRLTAQTAGLAKGHDVVCVFANDIVNDQAVEIFAELKIGLIALRSAGFNHVDLRTCSRLNIKVVRVPAYSPYSVAEHALCLILALNRKIHRAYARVRELDFSLHGLMGFDLHGKTVGVIGTGRIGSVFCRIMWGLGCNVLAFDQAPNKELVEKYNVCYCSLEEMYKASDILSLHVPLTPTTKHLIDAKAIQSMKRGVTIINTGRGALIDTKALITGLKSGQIVAAGLDVYEEEEGVFFFDLSERVLQDDVLARLLTFPNVLITAHQGFFTKEALSNIAQTTIENVSAYEMRQPLENEVRA